MSDADPYLGLYCRPGYMNAGVSGSYQAARVALPPDEHEIAHPIAARVIRAYQLAYAEHRSASPSLWDHTARQHRDFLKALRRGNVDTVSAMLSDYFHSALVWGLSRQPLADATPDAVWAHSVRTADALVSLAYAVGVMPVPSIEQGGALHHQIVPPAAYETLIAEIESATGLDLSIWPAAAGNTGWQFGERSSTIDVLLHSYTTLRLQQLGIAAEDPVVEIGGGYGCLAALALKAGFRRYTIFDLPWVNAIQGYLLIRTFGAEAVRLYGEDGTGQVSVLPFWVMHDLPQKSVSLVININSLPEIGHRTARAYIIDIARISRTGLLSINQEAQAATTHGTRQLRVLDLVREVGGLRLAGRHPFWMEQGYVEELYRPA